MPYSPSGLFRIVGEMDAVKDAVASSATPRLLT